MQTAEQINLIRRISWALAQASAEDCLDTPGEFVWAYPKNAQFWEVRSRSHSIFSSGNAIKDSVVIDFVNSLSLSEHLRDCWIVDKFQEAFPSWIAAGTRYKLHNL
jgi:hypothetical protein